MLGAASSDLHREHAFCLAVIPGQQPGYGAKGLVHMPVPFAYGDVTPFSSHCVLTVVKVQVVWSTVLGMALVGEVVSERAVWWFLISVLMSSAMLRTPKHTPEVTCSSM